jgi:hypothetical protein
MSRFRRPILINLAIIFGVILLNYLSSNDRFSSGIAITALAGINFLIGIIRNRNRKRDGSTYFIMSGVILLIGISVCSSG